MQRRSIYFLLFVLILPFTTVRAQAPKRYTSGEIYEAIKKLNFLGSALYIAAHPDDENTLFISYLANERKANVAYLSLTRGDGGQNLIGPEIRELLGLLRTQELLAARRIDGGKQLFTRANDFGFSKNPAETFQTWDRNDVLGDVVWAIRQWQPDVIVNRFDHRTAGTTHGHHTASAVLSVEAFDLANNPQAYPEQLAYVKPWQPRRTFFNISWFFFGSRAAFEKADKSKLFSVEAGGYFPNLGKSNTEIAAESRSSHRCQGFGSMGTRGTSQEYFEFIKGDEPKSKTDLFEGINTTWTRVPGGAPIGVILAAVKAKFRFDNPVASVPELVKAYQLIDKLPDGYWKRVKLVEIKDVIKACLGLYHETAAADFSAAPGDEMTIRTEVINRSPAIVVLDKVSIDPIGLDSVFNKPLANNQGLIWPRKVRLNKDMTYTSAYWLSDPGTPGMYAVKDQQMRGKPETQRAFKARYHYKIAGVPIVYETDIVYRDADPAKGEIYRPFEIIPPVFTKVAEKVLVFADNDAKPVSVQVKAGKGNISGTLKLGVPTGWKVEPAEANFSIAKKGDEKSIKFMVTPPSGASEGKIFPVATIDGQNYSKEMLEIKYDHIPAQTVLLNAEAKVAHIELKKAGQLLGYVAGAGDDIPASLQQIGYKVDMLSEKDLTPENLAKYDAVIMGIRAYNTIDALAYRQTNLMEYTRKGGTLIVQYNTNFEYKVEAKELAPFALNVSRDRVTDENAEVRFLKPEHKLLNQPNKITAQDFSGWVQERGLYFPNDWDKANFEAILSANDPGEPARDGGLLVAKYGSGYYIYTGYSWFRQLPAGVPGAYRIFANMISIGK
ncbi:PIG-L family deacetylase [Haliscomenobacter hydrossis]|uniref:LmbE family protein n=1 Tax=Haliscomenobacter hydrossis (strain ATCC 27775 / DSM 1100 / LMG 10767 / O) TaxID=760192 RepID=F4L0N6_HALH1|nr:PIG-L family deacetylase [Haliscomenobacter hydrossis]AEE49518.1 LmbE family protein [Haliscomenobacter hydrossis DSM 1100]